MTLPRTEAVVLHRRTSADLHDGIALAAFVLAERTGREPASELADVRLCPVRREELRGFLADLQVSA